MHTHAEWLFKLLLILTVSVCVCVFICYYIRVFVYREERAWQTCVESMQDA